MKLKRLLAFGSSLVLSLSSLFVFAPLAHAATITWDGGGSDNNFSTDENWVGDVAPTSGDSLVFNTETPGGHATYINDLVGASFTSITFTGNATTDQTVEGTAFTVTGGIIVSGGEKYPAIENNITFSGDQALNVGTGFLTLSGVVNGSANLTKTGTGVLSLTGNNTFTGNVVIDAGRIISGATGLGTVAGSTTVNTGADLTFRECDSFSVAENLILSGAASAPSRAKLSTYVQCSGGGAVDEVYGSAVAGNDTVTLSGTITLASSILFGSDSPLTTLTGALSGGFGITLPQGAAAKLAINSSANSSNAANGTLEAEALKQTLSNALPSASVLVTGKTEITLTGTRGFTTVGADAVLKGTGTVGALNVLTDGTLAPGLSPGCINSGNLTLSGTFEVEIGGTTSCSEHDQTKVTGSVNVTGGSLNVVRFNDFTPAAGQTYTIIDNDTAADAVTGTFTDLAEGATFDADGYVYSVSYVGGDGNDVVLTVVSVPETPNTGSSLITANPLATLAVTSGLAGAIALIARHYKKALARY